MISTWSEWKRYPRAGRGENIEAPISPGLFEVRYAGTGALHSFEAVDNVARALAPVIGRFQVVVQPTRPRQNAGPRIPHLRDHVPGGCQGRRRAHDRPPRNLYERRGLIVSFPQKCLKQPRVCGRCIGTCFGLYSDPTLRNSEE